MISTLAGLLGLHHAPVDLLWAAAVLCVSVALLGGWACDAVMGGIGFGVVGNAFLVLLSFLVGLKSWLTYFGPLSSGDLLVLLVISGGLAVSALLALASLKQLLRS